MFNNFTGEFVAENQKLIIIFLKTRPKAASVGPQIGGTFGKAYKKGVKIAFGTDVGMQPLKLERFVYMNRMVCQP